ncbi:hypothetical protein PgNI_06706 [Pyricularia grisea]|uniref:Amine oxidase n=1 Tax=Pyricularia grisea TaxID=148305 RepID=A0A6P8B5F0_PYRGI|nr:hypothetical protein PgNI_06706 [Pyricularia grisea]TLD10498.1 hypothetical protein PgNI_06706 [Pyricularia grisea]
MGKVKTLDLSNTSGAYFAPATITPAGSRLLHLAGQVGETKDGILPADYQSQIHLALLNLRKIIVAAGASIKDIAKLTLYIVNYDYTKRLHIRHLRKFLKGHRPAITLVPVPTLAVASWLFEVDAVVVQPDPASIVPPALSVARASDRYDAVIVGAGLAGLSAAHELIKAGLSCIILESRDRVGGKTWSQELAGGKGVVDLGAAWINDTNQTRMFDIAKRYGAELIEQNTQGNVVLEDFDGNVSSFTYGDLPHFDTASRKNVEEIRDMCEADCQALDTWKPENTELDSMTMEAYLRSRGASKAALASAMVWTRAMLGQDPADVSALYFLNYCKSGGGLLQMRSDRKGGGQHLRVRQGTQFFAKSMAAALPEGIVRLDNSVRAIVGEEVGGQLKVQTKGGIVYSARKVITTVPGPALQSILFYPPLSPVKRVWAESLSYGYYTKAMMQFKTPFWVEKGFCGLAQSFIGPASVVRDTSSPADDKHILTCFMASDPGIAWSKLSACEKELALMKQLSKLFDMSNLADQFVSLNLYEWNNDEWAGWGCPCTALSPGVLDTLGGDGLRLQAGNLHFAGTETAGEWKGYMEGAVRSGERAAAEVIRDLSVGPVSKL